MIIKDRVRPGGEEMATKKKARRSAKKKSSGSARRRKRTRPTRRETGAQVRRPAGEAQTLVEEGSRARPDRPRRNPAKKSAEEGARPQAREEVRFPEDRQEGGSPQAATRTAPAPNRPRRRLPPRPGRPPAFSAKATGNRESATTRASRVGAPPRRAGARARGRRGPPGGPSPVERFGSGRRFRAGRGEEERARRREW